MAEDVVEMRKLLFKEIREAKEDIILNFLRPIKKDMYLCCAKCCENQEVDTVDLYDCIIECNMKTFGANYYIISTFNDIKRRFKTCESKCNTGSGYDPKEDDDEGDDGEVTAEELKEQSFPAPEGGPESLLNDYFDLFDDMDLEHKAEEGGSEDSEKVDFKDCKTCNRLCIASYRNTLRTMLTTMRMDLRATHLAKKQQQRSYYDWSRAQTSVIF